MAEPQETNIVEAYIGEYASGKSENAVNRALDLLAQGRRVTLVDLDIVEPFYTLRPIKRELAEKGLQVIAWETRDTIGLGEVGNLLRGDMRWALRQTGDVILDVGYGVEGAKTLNLVEGAQQSKELQVLAVINISRPMTSSIEDIVEYVQNLGLVHGLINNTHLGEETELAIIQEGARVVTAAAHKLKVQMVATSADERFRQQLGERDALGNPVRYLKRYMPKTFW